jgi:hypothetical protein
VRRAFQVGGVAALVERGLIPPISQEAPLLFWGVWLAGAVFTVVFAVSALLYSG